MPYDSKSKFRPCQSLMVYTSSAGVTDPVVVRNYGDCHVSEFKNYSRSGTNAPTVRREASKAPPATPVQYKRIYVSVPNGPRLAYKVKNRHGRMVWARQPIIVEKLIPIRPKRLPRPKNKKSLDLIPNRLSYSQLTLTTFPSAVVSRSSSDSYVLSGDLWNGSCPATLQSSIEPWFYLTSTPGSLSVSLLDEVDRNAQTAFFSNVKGQSVNVAQMLAEKSQTAKLLTESVIRLAKTLRFLKKGDIGAAAGTILPNSPKGVANDWLVYQYGVKPLISDINGLIDNYTKPEFDVFDVKSKKSGFRTDMPNDQFVTYGIMRAHVRITRTSKVDVTYKSRFKSRFIPRNIAKLGFSNPAQLAWELLPFSFVADWFLPIGKYLTSYDAFSGLDVLWTTKTTFITERTIIERTFGGTAMYGYTCGSGTSHLMIEKVFCERKLIDPPPKPPYPAFKNPFSFVHLANAMALITQLRK